jgi:hypothetical protein
MFSLASVRAATRRRQGASPRRPERLVAARRRRLRRPEPTRVTIQETMLNQAGSGSGERALGSMSSVTD